jgi:hypothetical protein
MITVIFPTSRLSHHNRSAHVTLLHEQSTQPGTQFNATIGNCPIRRDYNLSLHFVDLPANACTSKERGYSYSGISEWIVETFKTVASLRGWVGDSDN